MASSSVRVAVRVRPLSEQESQYDSVVQCTTSPPRIFVSPNRSFTFDYVYPPESDQRTIFDTCIGPLLEKYLSGYNATVLAYGQTGSGKTYSMGIGLDSALEQRTAQEGIVPRFIHALFDHLSAKKRASSDYTFQVHASFLELYNEDLVDLACTTKREGLQVSIREDIHGNIRWVGVREVEMHNPHELLELLQKGSVARTTASTGMNRSSSRSHAIFSIQLTQCEGDSTRIVSKFHFVDLAGSERLKRTNAVGDRAKEGISINSGLLALGNVISALGDTSRRVSHIPYRDSKLTRLLQDSLGGNSQTLMLSCVSPASSNVTETLNTLKYANRARNIRNHATINIALDETDQLKAQIMRLKEELRGGDDFLQALNNEMDSLKNQVDMLNHNLHQMTTELATVKHERDMLLMLSQESGSDVGERRLAEFRHAIKALRTEPAASITSFVHDEAKQDEIVRDDDLETLVGSTSRRGQQTRVVSVIEEPEVSKQKRHSSKVGSKDWSHKRLSNINAVTFTKPTVQLSSAAAFAPVQMLQQVQAAMREDVAFIQQLRQTEALQVTKDTHTQSQPGYLANDSGNSSNNGNSHCSLTTLLYHLQRAIDQRRQLVDIVKHQLETHSKLQQALADQTAQHTAATKQHRRDLFAVKSQLETKLKKLATEHQSLKRKHVQLVHVTESARVKHKTEILGLKAKLEKADAEKKKLTKRMKQDAERHKERETACERNLQRVRKQETAAVAARKRLEREVVTYKSVSKRTNEEINTMAGQLKQVTLLLKKMLAFKDNRLDRRLLTKAMACASVRGVLTKQGTHRRNKSAKSALDHCRHAQKKQLVLRAIALHATHHATQKPIQELIQKRDRLMQEQRELLAERQLVLLEEAAASGDKTVDASTPQYMDDRIDAITVELDFIQQHIQCLRQPTPASQDKEWADIIDSGSQDPDVNADVAYEIALAIIRSLEPEEGRLVCEELLQDVIQLSGNQYIQELSIGHLYTTLQRLQSGLVQMRRAQAPDAQLDMLFCRVMHEAVVIRDGLALFPYTCIQEPMTR